MRVDQRRALRGGGADQSIVRYADDLIIGFEHEKVARASGK